MEAQVFPRPVGLASGLAERLPGSLVLKQRSFPNSGSQLLRIERVLHRGRGSCRGRRENTGLG